MGKTRSKRLEKKNSQPETEKKSQLIDYEADFIPIATEDTFDEDNKQEDESSFAFSSVRDNRSSFFGLLDRSELEYFKNAENILATNSLSASEREPFIESVFTEAKGKELKLATNQVCSKLFERMVQLANEEQLQQLVQAFENFSVDLAYQKFSSHCLEALIKRVAHIPSCVMLLEKTTENLLSHALDLMTDKYGAHVLCTLILILSGESGQFEMNTRSKRSKMARKHTDLEMEGANANEIQLSIDIPDKLKRDARTCISKFIDELQDDAATARKLATTQESSPVIQAIIVAEGVLQSTYKLVNLILEDSGGFISHCLTDQVGSHFIETVLKVLPSKRVAKFVDRLPIEKLALSDNEFSRYIVQTVLSAQCKLNKAKKLEIVNTIFKDISQVNKNMVLAALNVDYENIAQKITSELNNQSIDLLDASNAALYEKLSNYPPFVEKAIDALLSMEDKDVLEMGVDPIRSFVLQSFLKPEVSLISRRKLLNVLVPIVQTLAVNAYGSHIVDSLWDATFKLKFVRERIANELFKAAEQVKHSPYGKKVWKNWSMEKYAHRRHDWWQVVKDHEDELRKEIPEVAPTVTKGPQRGNGNAGHRNSTVKDQIPPSKKRRT